MQTITLLPDRCVGLAVFRDEIENQEREHWLSYAPAGFLPVIGPYCLMATEDDRFVPIVSIV